MKKLLRLTWNQVLARRLERHGLLSAIHTSPADVAVAMCGVHAQVLSAAELSIAIRLPNLTRADLQKELWTEHSLIKTFGPRGTVHLLAAKDLPLWTGALSGLPGSGANFPDTARMTAQQTEEVVNAIEDALKDDELTVDELTAAIVARVGAWAGDLVMPAFQTFWPRWRQAINLASDRGVLCFGPNRGRNVTYTNPRRWLGKFRTMAAKGALAELVRRYLYAYGPATPQHFSRWLNTPPRWTMELFASLAYEIEEVDIEGTSAWISAGDIKFSKAKPKGLRLLPYFDAYSVGSHPREVVFPGAAGQRALNRGQAGNFPVLLINGVAAGVWHLLRAGKKADITVEALTKLSAAQRNELDEQVERIGTFLEAKLTLKIGKVSVGGHA